MSSSTIGLLFAGFVALVLGAELLVRGAARLAASIGVPPLLVGLTIVAYGTSAPELAVSVQASLTGQSGIALGNVVGSNIFNVLFVLGVTATLAPLGIVRRLMRVDVPVMVVVSLFVIIAGADGAIGRAEGALLFVGMMAYTASRIWASRRERFGVRVEPVIPGGTPDATRGRIACAAALLVGLTLLPFGAHWLVNSAVVIAGSLGVSEMILGLTVVAVGTSLPELATSVIASLHGERDLAVGNVVGSCIFNILAVLGLAAIVAPHGLLVPRTALQFDIPVMVAAAIACLPVFFTGRIVSRWEGALFLGYYVAYTAYLVMEVALRKALPTFALAMRGFAIPLTAIALLVTAGRAMFGKPTDRRRLR